LPSDWETPRSDGQGSRPGSRGGDGDSFLLADYLRTLRRRWKLILVLTLAVFGAALVSSFVLEKRYDASVDLLLREPEQINSLLDPGGGGGGSSDVERELNTNVQLIKTEDTARGVRRRLGLQRSTEDLLKQVSTKTSNTSNIVALTVRDTNPELAAAIANAFAEAYVQFRITSSRRRYTQAAELAQQQLQQLSPTERASAEGRALESRQRELQIAAALQTGGAEIVRPAKVPTSPARPRPMLDGVLGLLLGLMFGAGVALVLELLDRRFKDEAAVEDFFELPLLAGIPRPTRWGGSSGRQMQDEAYGLLASNLRLTSRQTGSSTALMITSASPGEGKTSVTIGIARACARMGLRAIAIEADLRRPTFGRVTDVERSGGVSSVLSGSGDLARELLWLDPATMQPRAAGDDDHGLLGLLPAGDLPPNPQRALSRPEMGELVERARSLADIVLIDTAPTGTVNDPLTIVSHVDAIVIVARLEKTTKESARRALRVLRNAGVTLAGVVVTNTDVTDHYGYGYYATPSSSADRETVALPDDLD
jgi:capsular exopolysaccharide synthesis family protein